MCDLLMKTEKESRFHLQAFVLSFPCLQCPATHIVQPIPSIVPDLLLRSVARQLWPSLSSPPSELLCLPSSYNILFVFYLNQGLLTSAQLKFWPDNCLFSCMLQGVKQHLGLHLLDARARPPIHENQKYFQASLHVP